jgi:hypothetical protein
MFIEMDLELNHDPNNIRFLRQVDGGTVDEIYTCNQILDCIEQDNLDIDSGAGQL